MKQKGFTLVELLAVIIILGIIALIVVPIVNDTLKEQREKLYEKQINTIEEAVEGWGAVNTDKLPNAGDPTYYIKLEDLVEQGFLKNGDIKDPRTNDIMTGCVSISFDSDYNQYVYDYINPTDESYAGQCD